MNKEELVKQIIELLNKGLKRKEICEELQISIYKYKNLNNEFHFYKNEKKDKPLYKDKKWLEEQIRTIGNLSEIARQINVSDDTINKWRIKFNIPKSEKSKNATRYYHINKKFFEKIDTEEKAYWLGFLMADGYVSKKGRIEINLKMLDKNHLEKLNNSLDSTYKIIDKHIINKKLDFESNICQLRINCAEMANDLNRLGIVTQKTGKEVIPEIPKELYRHFIRGFFDGDGCIDKNKKISIGSCSKYILIQINEFLNTSIGQQYTIYERKEYTKPFYLFDSNDKKKNKLFLDLLYKDSTIYLDRKFEIYNILYCTSIK